MTTAYVTTGSCAYGVCFDVAAKDQPVTVTKLYTASSPVSRVSDFRTHFRVSDFELHGFRGSYCISLSGHFMFISVFPTGLLDAGMFSEVTAKDQPITVTKLYAASSPVSRFSGFRFRITFSGFEFRVSNRVFGFRIVCSGFGFRVSDCTGFGVRISYHSAVI